MLPRPGGRQEPLWLAIRIVAAQNDPRSGSFPVATAMIRAELIQLQPCVPGDPCLEAGEWRGLGQELGPESIGTCWKVVLKESGEVIGNGGFLVLDDEDAIAEIYFRLEGE